MATLGLGEVKATHTWLHRGGRSGLGPPRGGERRGGEEGGCRVAEAPRKRLCHQGPWACFEEEPLVLEPPGQEME